MTNLDIFIATYYDSNNVGRGCAGLRDTAAAWTGTRGEFIAICEQHGVNKATAATQWQKGRAAPAPAAPAANDPFAGLNVIVRKGNKALVENSKSSYEIYYNHASLGLMIIEQATTLAAAKRKLASFA